MKKFLNLKKNIVQSKNQSTLLQSYLNTIRSSCYKLVPPCLISNSSNQHSISSSLPINHPNASINEIKTKVSNPDNPLNNRNTLPSKSIQKKNKKMTYRYNLSDFMQSTEESQHSPNTYQYNNNFNHPNASTYTFTSQIQQIFQTLSSNCKSYCKNNQNQPFKSQKQIIQTILYNLNILSQKKQYHQSIQLIKNIIEGMSDPNTTNNKYTDIDSNSQIKKISYIMKTPETDGYGNLQASHFKSCMQYRHQKQDNISINNDITRSENVNKNKNVAMKIDWFHPAKRLEQNPIPSPHKQKIKKHSSTQNLPYNPPNDTPQIYIQDQSQHNFHQNLYTQSQQYLDNSMKSQDHKQWTNDQLYCISEHQQQQQDQKSLTPSSSIPEQTIQFKKILYMLDSGNTNKKTFQSNNAHQKLTKNLQIKPKNSTINSLNSLNNTTTHLQTPHKQNLSKTQQIKPQNVSTAQKQNHNKTIIFKCHKNPIDPVNHNLHSHSTKTATKSKTNAKHSQKNQYLPNNTNKVDKDKGLQDIVNMLNNKYNCAIKFNK